MANSQTETDPQANYSAPGYILKGKLGTGGMGDVFRATQESTGREVAIKFARQTKRFFREYTQLKKCHHPRVVQALEFNPQAQPPYLVMEFIDGVTLAEALRAMPGGRLPVPKLLDVFSQVAAALDAIHRQGAVHRDLKPQNVMLRQHEQASVVVMDFGLAKAQDDTPMTSIGVSPGTPAYMAPEQVEKPQVFNQSADLYALGVMLYEAATGQRPTASFVPPVQLVPDLPPALNTLILHLLEKDPQKRPASADQVLGRLSVIARQTFCPRCGLATQPSAPICAHCQENLTGVFAGRRLHNRYQVESLIGQGGFGLVYRATDEHNAGAPCVIKVNQHNTPEAAAQFDFEADLLARLNHPGLPQLLDRFREGSTDCMVMDFAGDVNLNEVRRTQGALPPEQVMAWADQLCDLLDYLHNQQPPIIHRDIKPANILLGAQGQINLVDFGIAKEQRTGVTTTLAARGISEGYSPPEQYVRGATEARSDLYALGATLYALLTGVEPPDSLAMREGQAPPLKPVHEVRPDVPVHLSHVVSKAMQFNKDERFARASDLKTALHNPEFRLMAPTHPADTQLANTQPAVTKPAPPSPPPTRKNPRPSQRSWWLMAILSMAALLVMGLLSAGAYIVSNQPLPAWLGDALGVDGTPIAEFLPTLPLPRATAAPSPTANTLMTQQALLVPTLTAQAINLATLMAGAATTTQDALNAASQTAAAQTQAVLEQTGTAQVIAATQNSLMQTQVAVNQIATAQAIAAAQTAIAQAAADQTRTAQMAVATQASLAQTQSAANQIATAQAAAATQASLMQTQSAANQIATAQASAATQVAQAAFAAASPNLTGSAIGGQFLTTSGVQLNWTPVTGATDYYIEVLTTNGTPIQASRISSLSWTVSGLGSGTYAWRVKARNNLGTESAWSGTASFTMLDPWSSGDIHRFASGQFESTWQGTWAYVNGFKSSSTTYCSISGNPIFTWSRTNMDTWDKEWARWRPNLPHMSRYRVFVHIPDYYVNDPYNEPTRSAIYRITHANGTTNVTISQNAARCQWVDLGVYTFNAGNSGFLQIGDYTGERERENLSRLVSVDAARFVLEP